MPRPKRILVLFEHGYSWRPYGSAWLRLLRPLSHPALRPHFDLQQSLGYNGERVDLVVVDRLWRPDVTLEQARELVKRVRLGGARLVYAVDDDYAALPDSHPEPGLREKTAVVDCFLEAADAVVVSSQALKER
ncbi:MAG: hypothetical protein ACKOC5_07970, partial [Chloroflexota bacterium]